MSEIKTPEQAREAFGLLMGEAPTEPAAETPPAAEPSSDPLVNELRGTIQEPNEAEAASEGSQGNEPEPLDTPADVLDKLRKANQDAGKAGYQLGQARKELAQKDQQLAQMTARLDALEAGRSVPPAQAEEAITRLSDSQLDGLMSQFDPKWEENREDPYKKSAAEYAANMVMTLYQQVRGELGGIAGGVQDMQFNTRLERLGISRAQFDAVWQDPAYAWGTDLSSDARLAALETQAGTMGTLPPAAAAPTPTSSVPGARPTSRVNPRTIETTQAPSSASNPMRLSELEMNTALEKKDFGAARKAAAPLFERLMQGG